jgi:aldehyde dehydrogenase (NAD+)
MQNPPLDPVAPNASKDDILRIFAAQQAHRPVMARTTAKERIARLQKLSDCMIRRKPEIEAAMWADFRKGPTEVTVSEMSPVLAEIRHVKRHLVGWMRDKQVDTPITSFGASTWIQYQPKGVCLLLSTWNYPFNITLGPLVMAIAAGNCVMVKPSEFAVQSSALIKSIIEECFPPEEVAVFEGGVPVSQVLFDLPFDHIFFTGSPAVGKLVMAAAAKHLSTVTLELGGKSPVIVDKTADLDVAASKIAWLKAMNAGQICIAPDYILVDASVHDALIQKVGEKLQQYYGQTPEQRQQSPDIARVVNYRHFYRIKNLLDDAVQKGAKVAFGGHTDELERFVEPTVLTNVPAGAAIWDEEIFGSLLPVRTYTDLNEALEYIRQRPKPLALYIFTRSSANRKTILRETSSGGAVVNDIAIQYVNANIPFGGINNSGMGQSHGEFGFRSFSHERGVMHQTRFMPTSNFLLPPYGGRLARVLLAFMERWA